MSREIKVDLHNGPRGTGAVSSFSWENLLKILAKSNALELRPNERIIAIYPGENGITFQFEMEKE